MKLRQTKAIDLYPGQEILFNGHIYFLQVKSINGFHPKKIFLTLACKDEYDVIDLRCSLKRLFWVKESL